MTLSRHPLPHPDGHRPLPRPEGLYFDRLPVSMPTVEQMAEDVLLAMSKLRDRLVHENKNIPACRVDEAMETTLSAVRSAMGIEQLERGGRCG